MRFLSHGKRLNEGVVNTSLLTISIEKIKFNKIIRLSLEHLSITAITKIEPVKLQIESSLEFSSN